MAITDGANRNPAATSAGQPQAHPDAGVRAVLHDGPRDLTEGAAPIGPNQNPGQDAGTAAAMKKGRQSAGSTAGSANPG